MNTSDKLLKLIPKLDMIQFTALARILKVKLIYEANPEAEDKAERYVARDFNEVLADILQNFESAPRTRRREIIQILSAAIRAGGEENAYNS